jgi:spore coat polysaccharide biosynthesis protein SpsF (cytidylyltransferase family)
MSNIIAIIQARMGSTRLPNKVVLPLEGKTVLEHVVARVRQSRLIKEAVVATTVSVNDLRIVNLCSSKGIRVYCGSENDVLDRYFEAARLIGAEHVIRITADCPFMDHRVIDKVIKAHLSEKNDYTSNTIKETFPDGEDVEILTFKALEKTWKNAGLSSEREHVTPYIRNNPRLFKIGNVICSGKNDLSGKRWTLDEKKDYEFIKLVYKYLYKRSKFFGMEEVLKLLKQHPEYEKINYLFGRNEGYLKSLKEDKNTGLLPRARR